MPASQNPQKSGGVLLRYPGRRPPETIPQTKRVRMLESEHYVPRGAYSTLSTSRDGLGAWVSNVLPFFDLCTECST